MRLARIPRPELVAKLGAGAFTLWTQLVTIRDHYGGRAIFVSDARLAAGYPRGFEAQPLWSVRRGMRKLERAGLVEPLHWRKFGSQHPHRVRAIRGFANGPTCLVPLKTGEWCEAKVSGGDHGGWRSGAGRKRSKHTPASMSESRNSSAHSDDLTLTSLTCVRFSKEKQTHTAFFQNAVFSFFGERGERTVLPPTPEPTIEWPTDDADSASIVIDPVRRGLPPRQTSGARNAYPTPPGQLPDLVSLSATSLVVVVPTSPRLSPDDKPCRWAALLAGWFVQAVEAHYPGKTCWPLKRAHVSRTAHYSTFCDAARLFVEHKVRPVSWIHFSIEAWKAYGGGKGSGNGRKSPPSIAWVFSLKRIRERLKWYDSEAGQYEQARLVYTPLGQEFMRKQARMEFALRWARAESPAAALRSVEETFPDRDELLERLRVEVREAQASVDADIRNGKLLWQGRTR